MKKSFLLLITCVLLLQAASAQLNTGKSNLAIEGYDPVAYFTQHKAVEGNKDISLNSQGTIYYFTTSANRELFKADAEKYKPQYGGWCAYAMGASGEKVEVDPETFKVLNGKLYLFYNKYFTNTLKSWNKDEASLKTKADANWIKLNKNK